MKNKLIFMFIAAIIRVFPFGLKYYPQLDDYIQYGAYPNIENAYMAFKLYAFRPLAGIFDIYIWGKMWGCMWLALFIITAMHVLSCWIFMKVAEVNGHKLGLVFAAVYLLFPLNIEGAYWISASSRIIVPLFFCSVSLLLLSKGKHIKFALLQLVSFLFYEQVFAFSALTAFLLSVKRHDKKGIFLTAINSAFVVIYYIIFASAGGRTKFTLFNKDAFVDILHSWKLSGVFNMGNVSLWFVLMAVLAGIMWWDKSNISANKAVPFVFGVVVFIISYLPLIVSGINGVAMRSAFLPLMGVGIMADYLCSKTSFYNVIAPILTVIFLISSHGHIDGYRENYLNDRQLVEYVWENTDTNAVNVIANSDEYYINQGYTFKEHIKSIVSSDWAITGAVREHTGNLTLPYYLFTPPDDTDCNIIDLAVFREEP